MTPYFEAPKGMELLRRLPPVLRGRDFRLYLDGGQRLTDLWQLGGRAILGHKPPGLLRELKNAAERGLFAPLPHPMEKRFFKALARLFPQSQFSFRLYGSMASLEAALEKAGFPGDGQTWRPFLEEASNKSKAPLFVPVLPWVFSPAALVLEKSLEDRFPPGDLLSPVILGPATRSIYELIAAGKDGGRPPYPRIKKALSGAGCKWRAQGIYLFPSPQLQENWKQVWEYFLEEGFLLPPSPDEPLILPWRIPNILSQGEETKLANLIA